MEDSTRGGWSGRRQHSKGLSPSVIEVGQALQIAVSVDDNLHEEDEERDDRQPGCDSTCLAERFRAAQGLFEGVIRLPDLHNHYFLSALGFGGLLPDFPLLIEAFTGKLDRGRALLNRFGPFGRCDRKGKVRHRCGTQNRICDESALRGC
ncbi:MAG: hypothetical protein AAGB11_07305 [Pseudomonadota bacterium]